MITVTRPKRGLDIPYDQEARKYFW